MRGISFIALIASIVLLAACASGSTVQFTVDEAEQNYLNTLHHPETQHHAEQLLTAFVELDSNADGHIDGYELKSLEDEGRISAAEHILLRAFDLNGDGALSQSEMTLAPHTLNLLETSVELDMPPRPTAEEMAAAAAFEGQEFHPAMMARPTRRLKSRQQLGEDAVLSEMSSMSYAIPPAGTPRVKKTKRGNAPLPVSVFGVPSVSDEECVLCQYFVQRIQGAIADRLENGPAAPGSDQSSAGAAGLAGSAAAAQQALKVRNTNAQLQKKPGGRGIVRVVAEDVLSALCAVDKMPLLFTPYCSGITEPNAINAVRKAIFFNIPTIEVCQQAALCRDDSYVNTNAAVHASKTSLFLNSQRGICGMLGGSRDRPNSREGQILNVICAAHGAVFGQ